MLLAHLVHHFPQGAQKGLIAAGKCRIPGPDLFIRGINQLQVFEQIQPGVGCT